jgi:hypothetical protein
VSRRKAIDIAMDALENPGITSFLSVGPLPDGVKSLLRIVAEGEWRDASTEHVYREHGAEKVRAASAAFLSAVLFGRQTDPYRMLGLPQGAPLGEVRENKRLLLKWLHPDRNPESRERENLTRVIEAAEAIEAGRSHQFGGTVHARPTPAAASGSGSGSKRGAAPAVTRRALVLPRGVSRAARLAVSQSIPVLLRAARLSAVSLAILLCILIAWRHVMGEPIGTSIAKYSKLAVGLVARP